MCDIAMELKQRRKQWNLAQYPQLLKASFSSSKDVLPVETPLSLHLPLSESLENIPLRHFSKEMLLTKWIAPTCNIVDMILVTLYATVSAQSTVEKLKGDQCWFMVHFIPLCAAPSQGCSLAMV